MGTEDSVDRHVARWREWSEIPFDDEVEAITTRIVYLRKHLHRTTGEALADVALQAFEYDTLHAIMLREPPGVTSPGELAETLMISPAGITGRLDSMEEAGLLRRVRSTTDKRRLSVEITPRGRALWRQAMHARGSAEDDMVGALTRAEQRTLNRLLKKMLLHVEQGGG